MPKNSEEDEMSTLTSLAVTTCLYSIKSSLSPSYLSFSPTVSSQTTKANHHRKKKRKNKQLRDRHHPPEKKQNGDRRQVIQRSILLWFVPVLSVFDFFFPRKRNVRRSWSVFAFFVCLLDGAEERLKESSNIIAKYPDRVPVNLIKCLEIIVWFLRLTCDHGSPRVRIKF